MDAALWFRDWAVQYDGFPEDYLVIDTETTGRDVDKDLILQLGWCQVVNRRVVDNDGVILNWGRKPYIDPSWVARRMGQTAAEMKKKHMVYPWDMDVLSHGQNPVEALTDFLERLCDVREKGQVIVAHNGVSLDFPIISSHFRRFLKLNFEFQPEEVWDTGALEKACQLDEFLYGSELPGDFAWRVIERNTDRGINWSLHEHVIPKYNLTVRYNLDLLKSHTAPFDAYVTHLLFEEFRTLAEDGLARFPP